MKTRTLNDHLFSLLAAHHLLSANQLLVLLEKEYQAYNKTSVYRALERLLSEGKICHYVFDGKEAVYELREHHHDHAICESCGAIEAISCHSPTLSLKNFAVDHHHTVVYGTCHHCQSRSVVS